MGRHGVSSRRHAVRRACGGGAVGRLQRGSQVNLSLLDTSKTRHKCHALWSGGRLGRSGSGRLLGFVLSLKGKGLPGGQGSP
jgi:hypothetical protein